MIGPIACILNPESYRDCVLIDLDAGESDHMIQIPSWFAFEHRLRMHINQGWLVTDYVLTDCLQVGVRVSVVGQKIISLKDLVNLISARAANLANDALVSQQVETFMCEPLLSEDID